MKRTLSLALALSCLVPQVARAQQQQEEPLPAGAVRRLGMQGFAAGTKVTALAVSPDGSLVASAGHDAKVRVFRVRTGELLREIEDGGRGIATDLAFAPSGVTLLCARASLEVEQSRVRVIDLATGAPGVEMDLAPAQVLAIAFAPDGKAVALGGDGRGPIGLFDTATGRRVRELGTHGKPVAALAFARDGRRVASCGYDRTVRIWDVATGRKTLVLNGHTEPVRDVAFSADGQRLATGGDDGTIRVWEAENGEETLRIDARIGAVRAVAFAPDGVSVAGAGEGRAAGIFDAATGAPRQRLLGHEDEVTGVAFTPDARTVFTACADGGVRPFDAGTGKSAVEKGHTLGVTAVAYAGDGARIVTCGHDQTIRVWDAKSGKEQRRLVGSRLERVDPWAGALVVFAGGRYALTGGPDGNVWLWGLDQSRRVPHAGHKGAVTCLATTSDRKTFASGAADRTCRIWNLESGEEVRRIDAAGEVEDVAFAPDDKLLAVGTASTVALYDVATGAKKGDLATPGVSLAFSPDGARLASWDGRGAIVITEVASAKEQRRIAGRGLAASVALRSGTLAFSPDGRLLATAAELGVDLFDAATGERLAAATGHLRPAQAVAFSPDGAEVATASEDTTVIIWSVRALLEKR